MMGCESYDIPRDRRIIASIREEEPIRHQTQWGEVIYSPQYSDDQHVYRHVSLPRKMWKVVNSLLAERRLLSYDDVVNKLHIPMSNDWSHYLTLRRDMTLMFKRPRRE